MVTPFVVVGLKTRVDRSVRQNLGNRYISVTAISRSPFTSVKSSLGFDRFFPSLLKKHYRMTSGRIWLLSDPRKQSQVIVVRSGFQCIADLPKVMVSDRDGIFGEWFGEFLKDYYEMELIRTPPRTPNCNSFIERWHRSFREEVLDHSLIFGTKDLRRLTTDYVSYYHHQRPHQGLKQNSPLKIHGGTSCNKTAKIKRSKVVDGLITNFERAAWINGHNGTKTAPTPIKKLTESWLTSLINKNGEI